MAVQQNICCKVPVKSRDNFMSDPFFKNAREILDQAMKKMNEAFAKPADCASPVPNQVEMQQMIARLYAQSVENFQAIVNCVANPGQSPPPAQAPQIAREVCQLPTLNKAKVDQLKVAATDPNRTKRKPDVFRPACFEVIMDMADFKAEDIVVNVENNILEIYAVAEIAEGNICTTRTIRRKYKLPPNVCPESLVCNLSCDGVMAISAPWAY